MVLEDDDKTEVSRTFRVYQTGELILTPEWQYLGTVFGNRHVFEWYQDMDEAWQQYEEDQMNEAN